MPTREKHTPLSRTFYALSSPLRLRILSAMAGESASAASLADLFDGEYSLNHIAYHVKVLREASMIEEVWNRQVRGAVEHFYRVNPVAFQGLSSHPDTPPSLIPFLGELSANAFISALVDAARLGTLSTPESIARWRPLQVDVKGRQEVATVVADVLAAFDEIEKRSAKRAKGQGRLLGTALVGAAVFRPAGRES